MPDLAKKYGHRAIQKVEGTTWMNQELTLLGQSLFGRKWLLAWDSFKCHISKETKGGLKRLKIDAQSCLVDVLSTFRLPTCVGINH